MDLLIEVLHGIITCLSIGMILSWTGYWWVNVLGIVLTYICWKTYNWLRRKGIINH